MKLMLNFDEKKLVEEIGTQTKELAFDDEGSAEKRRNKRRETIWSDFLKIFNKTFNIFFLFFKSQQKLFTGQNNNYNFSTIISSFASLRSVSQPWLADEEEKLDKYFQ